MIKFKKIFGLLNKKREINLEGEESNLEEMIIPSRWKEKFDIASVKKKPAEWVIILEEKKENIPEEAKGKEVIAKGFLNQVEIIAFPALGLPVYLQFKRRRWKNNETEEYYCNQYEFHPPGMKILHEFGDFLKGADREIIDALFHDWKNIRHIRKEAFYVVS